MRRLLTLLVALLAGVFVAFAQDEDPWARVGVGDRVPEFEVRMTSGARLSSADLEGRVVWICLWASWCPSCRREFGWLAKSEEFAALRENKEFLFLPIAREENMATVVAWLKKQGYDFIVGEDPKRSVYELFAEQDIPRNIIVGKDGVIALHSSACSRKTIASVIEKAKDMLN